MFQLLPNHEREAAKAAVEVLTCGVEVHPRAYELAHHVLKLVLERHPLSPCSDMNAVNAVAQQAAAQNAASQFKAHQGHI